LPLVTFNGFTGNRAGYFATFDVKSEREDDLVTTRVTITNEAPDRPPSILLGLSKLDTGGMPLGTFGTDVNLYLPPGATGVRSFVDGQETVPFEQRDSGRRVVSEIAMALPNGGRARLVFTYTLG
jgi:hypothetical protein